MEKDVVIAILAKDKAHTLELYLSCILNLDFDKSKIRLYVRTNDNTDATEEIIAAWLSQYGSLYKSVHFDNSSVNESLKSYANHQWNAERFTVLAKIRQESVEYAKRHGCDYYVIDCDNFVVARSLKDLRAVNLPVVAPMLVTTHSAYSNFHNEVDESGYLRENNSYYEILSRRVKGLIDLPVVHCTYFIKFEALKHVNYQSECGRHEYVIFSENLRNANIGQYLDNRLVYGLIVFFEEGMDTTFYGQQINLWNAEYV